LAVRKAAKVVEKAVVEIAKLLVSRPVKLLVQWQIKSVKMARI